MDLLLCHVNTNRSNPYKLKLLSLLPASTTASRSFTPSKIPSRTPHDDSDHHDAEETEESETQSTTAPPTTKKSRPLSQTRSYHSIFSVRGSVRNPGPSSRTTSRVAQSRNGNKELDDEETPAGSPKEDEANEAVEDIQPENTNNVLSKVEEETPKKSLPEVKESSPVIKSSQHNIPTSPPKPSTFDSLPKTSEGHRHTQHLKPRLRRPTTHTSGSRSGAQNGVSQESAATRKDYMASSYPERKDLNSKMNFTKDKSSTPSPQETRTETSSSDSLPSLGTRHGSSTGSGSVTSTNSRRVGISTRGHRHQMFQPKRSSSSSTSSQSSPATGSRTSDKSGTHSTSIQDIKDGKESYHEHVETENKESPTHQPTTTYSSPKKESPQERKDNIYEEKSDSSYATVSRLPSRTNSSLIGRGSSLQNRNSRIQMSSRRSDGRIPWSRTASSIGAGRPILRGAPFRSSVLVVDSSDKTKVPPTTSPSKHEVDPTPAPTAISKQTHSTSELTTSNDHEDDYLYEGSKEISNKDNIPAAPSKTTASDVEIQQPVQTSKDVSQSVPTVPRRAVIGSNGRFRSPVVASRPNGTQFTDRLQPVQHTRLGSPAKQNTPPTENSNGNIEADSKTSAQSRNPVVSSRLRYPSGSETISRGKSPVSGYKPGYGQGRLNILH